MTGRDDNSVAAGEAFDEPIIELSQTEVDLIAAAASSSWLPIETAPRDGSALLGVWWSNISVGRAPEPHIGICSWAGAWTPYDRKPTHWMPLPAPPSASTDANAAPSERSGEGASTEAAAGLATCSSGVTSDSQRLHFLIGETRKALAVFAELPLAEYFRRNQEGDRLALAIEQASDHLASALNILRSHEPGLTPSEARAQAERCSCRGSDDYCACQNVPDHQTRAGRR